VPPPLGTTGRTDEHGPALPLSLSAGAPYRSPSTFPRRSGCTAQLGRSGHPPDLAYFNEGRQGRPLRRLGRSRSSSQKRSARRLEAPLVRIPPLPLEEPSQLRGFFTLATRAARTQVHSCFHQTAAFHAKQRLVHRERRWSGALPDGMHRECRARFRKPLVWAKPRISPRCVSGRRIEPKESSWP
jgi:hypothetical protein